MNMSEVFQLRLIWKVHRMMMTRIVGMCQHLSIKPSDLGERKEVIPQEPESDFSEDFEQPQLLGSLLQHEARGHWRYDKGSQARESTPARRRCHEGGDDQSPALTSMAADLTFVASRARNECPRITSR